MSDVYRVGRTLRAALRKHKGKIVPSEYGIVADLASSKFAISQSRECRGQCVVGTYLIGKTATLGSMYSIHGDAARHLKITRSDVFEIELGFAGQPPKSDFARLGQRLREEFLKK